jgi:hypothetical protein
MADMLIEDLKRELVLLKKLPAPLHDKKQATGFHH